MKILLVCAGGYSTSILMNKIKKYAEAHGEDLEINAVAKTACEEMWQNYDCILVGPQISYAIDDLKQTISIPIAPISSLDYSIGRAENVLKLAHQITGK